MIKSLSALAMTMFVSSSVLATTPVMPPPAATPKMSCAISVYKAKDFLDLPPNATNESFNIISVDLPGAELDFDQEFQVRGETVLMSLRKFEYADLYEISAAIKSTVPGATGVQAIYSDYLVNDGPAEGEWDINPGPNSTRFAYLQRQGGGIGLSKNMVNILKAEGLWGKSPFFSPTLSVMGSDLTEVVEGLVNSGKLQLDDVVGIAALLSCSLEK